jgi:hypothetical protein
MRRTDHSRLAAAIADDMVADSGELLDSHDRDSLRGVLRIAFEVSTFLASVPRDQEGWQWMRDTLFSGLESIDGLRATWQLVLVVHDDELAKAFPSDPATVRDDLAKIWHAVKEGAPSVSAPPYLQDRGPGSDTFPTDVDDVQRQLVDALQSVQDRALPIVSRMNSLRLIARLHIVLLGATLW